MDKISFELDKVDQQIQKFTNLPARTESAMEQMLELAAKKEHLQTQLYNNFPDKQIFISLDQFYGKDNEEINKILFNSTRLTLTGHSMLYGKDWRKPSAKT